MLLLVELAVRVYLYLALAWDVLTLGHLLILIETHLILEILWLLIGVKLLEALVLLSLIQSGKDARASLTKINWQLVVEPLSEAFTS